MIIVRTPLRISFSGGGTDLRSYYARRGFGAVVSVTIQKYIHVLVHDNFDDQVRLFHAEDTELVASASDLRHDLVRTSLLAMDVHRGVEIACISDVPGRGTGLGSSSALTVGLLQALSVYKGQPMGAWRLAKEASRLEIEVLKSPIGKQDQYAASIGGLNFIRFDEDESVVVEGIPLSAATQQHLQDRILAFYTGFSRQAGRILQDVFVNIQDQHEALMDRTRDQSLEMREVLLSEDLGRFGELLHEGWLAKRGLHPTMISNARIDEAYDLARDAGASGGKLCGAGGGGFLIFYVEPERQQAVREALGHLKELDLRFETQGSRILEDRR